MTNFHGAAAKVTFTGGSSTITSITGWSMSSSNDIAESTVMQESGFWESHEVGYKDATATVDGNAQTDRDTVDQIGSGAALALYYSNSNYFGFTAICTGISESVDKDDIGKITYTFEMNDINGVAHG